MLVKGFWLIKVDVFCFNIYVGNFKMKNQNERKIITITNNLYPLTKKSNATVIMTEYERKQLLTKVYLFSFGLINS